MQHIRSRRVVNKYIVHTPYKDVVKTMRYKRPAYTARKFLAMPRLKQESIKRMSDGIDKECTLFCTKNNSILATAKCKYTQFSWVKLFAELRSNAPTLLAMLKAASKYSIKSKIRLCVAASVLFYSRSQLLNVVQLFIGSILYTGHAAKKVIKYNYRTIKLSWTDRLSIITVFRICN